MVEKDRHYSTIEYVSWSRRTHATYQEHLLIWSNTCKQCRSAIKVSKDWAADEQQLTFLGKCTFFFVSKPPCFFSLWAVMREVFSHCFFLKTKERTAKCSLAVKERSYSFTMRMEKIGRISGTRNWISTSKNSAHVHQHLFYVYSLESWSCWSWDITMHEKCAPMAKISPNFYVDWTVIILCCRSVKNSFSCFK